MKRIGLKKIIKNTAKKESFKEIQQQMLSVGTFLTFLDKSDVSPQTVHVAAFKNVAL